MNVMYPNADNFGHVGDVPDQRPQTAFYVAQTAQVPHFFMSSGQTTGPSNQQGSFVDTNLSNTFHYRPPISNRGRSNPMHTQRRNSAHTTGTHSNQGFRTTPVPFSGTTSHGNSRLNVPFNVTVQNFPTKVNASGNQFQNGRASLPQNQTGFNANQRRTGRMNIISVSGPIPVTMKKSKGRNQRQKAPNVPFAAPRLASQTTCQISTDVPMFPTLEAQLTTPTTEYIRTANAPVSCHGRAETSKPRGRLKSDTPKPFKVPNVPKLPQTPIKTYNDAHTPARKPAVTEDFWEFINSPQVPHKFAGDDEDDPNSFWVCDPEVWRQEQEKRRMSSQENANPSTTSNNAAFPAELMPVSSHFTTSSTNHSVGVSHTAPVVQSTPRSSGASQNPTLSQIAHLVSSIAPGETECGRFEKLPSQQYKASGNFQAQETISTGNATSVIVDKKTSFTTPMDTFVYDDTNPPPIEDIEDILGLTDAYQSLSNDAQLSVKHESSENQGCPNPKTTEVTFSVDNTEDTGGMGSDEDEVMPCIVNVFSLRREEDGAKEEKDVTDTAVNWCESDDDHDASTFYICEDSLLTTENMNDDVAEKEIASTSHIVTPTQEKASTSAGYEVMNVSENENPTAINLTTAEPLQESTDKSQHSPISSHTTSTSTISVVSSTAAAIPSNTLVIESSNTSCPANNKTKMTKSRCSETRTDTSFDFTKNASAGVTESTAQLFNGNNVCLSNSEERTPTSVDSNIAAFIEPSTSQDTLQHGLATSPHAGISSAKSESPSRNAVNSSVANYAENPFHNSVSTNETATEPNQLKSPILKTRPNLLHIFLKKSKHGDPSPNEEQSRSVEKVSEETQKAAESQNVIFSVNDVETLQTLCCVALGRLYDDSGSTSQADQPSEQNNNSNPKLDETDPRPPSSPKPSSSEANVVTERVELENSIAPSKMLKAWLKGVSDISDDDKERNKEDAGHDEQSVSSVLPSESLQDANKGPMMSILSMQESLRRHEPKHFGSEGAAADIQVDISGKHAAVGARVVVPEPDSASDKPIPNPSMPANELVHLIALECSDQPISTPQCKVSNPDDVWPFGSPSVCEINGDQGCPPTSNERLNSEKPPGFGDALAVVNGDNKPALSSVDVGRTKSDRNLFDHMNQVLSSDENLVDTEEKPQPHETRKLEISLTEVSNRQPKSQTTENPNKSSSSADAVKKLKRKRSVVGSIQEKPSAVGDYKGRTGAINIASLCGLKRRRLVKKAEESEDTVNAMNILMKPKKRRYRLIDSSSGSDDDDVVIPAKVGRGISNTSLEKQQNQSIDLDTAKLGEKYQTCPRPTCDNSSSIPLTSCEVPVQFAEPTKLLSAESTVKSDKNLVVQKHSEDAEQAKVSNSAREVKEKRGKKNNKKQNQQLAIVAKENKAKSSKKGGAKKSLSDVLDCCKKKKLAQQPTIVNYIKKVKEKSGSQQDHKKKLLLTTTPEKRRGVENAEQTVEVDDRAREEPIVLKISRSTKSNARIMGKWKSKDLTTIESLRPLSLPCWKQKICPVPAEELGKSFAVAMQSLATLGFLELSPVEKKPFSESKSSIRPKKVDIARIVKFTLDNSNDVVLPTLPNDVAANVPNSPKTEANGHKESALNSSSSVNKQPKRPIILVGEFCSAKGKEKKWYTREKVELQPCSIKLEKLIIRRRSIKIHRTK